MKKNQAEKKRIMVSQNCDEMLVYGLQHAGPPSPGTLPTSLFMSSSIWTTTPPSQPSYPNSPSSPYSSSKNPPSLHSPQILPSRSHLALLPLAGFRTLVLVYMAAEGSTPPDFQETVQVYMPIHALSSAS